MNKKLLLTLLILLIPLVSALENCKGTMFTNDIPCAIFLPVNTTTTPCSTIDVSVFNNGSTLLYTQTMGELNSFNCEGTFNQTTIGTYTFLFSTEDSGSIDVVEDENQQYYLYVVVLVIFFILVGIGYWKEIGELVMIAGIMAIGVGINIFTNGFPNLTNEFLRNFASVILWGVGVYLLFAPAMEFFENWGSKE